MHPGGAHVLLDSEVAGKDGKSSLHHYITNKQNKIKIKIEHSG